ncbi:ABC transporter substrate-binding protein [Sebaldella sp. S0638]|uniref:ABC transporter substrate-binding protein n=1 Tax=Sebaldella sp. S0638 TaxID=2957809 RepID=UPI00209C7BF3|nr:ABC transporter substrate-binding protein [Sebaldella sp. S0638]
MKRIGMIFLSLLLVFSCGKESTVKETKDSSSEKATVKFIFPDGLPALSVLGMYSENKQFEDSINIEYEKSATVETLVGSLLTADENIIAIVPSSLAAQLYNKSMGYKILGTVSWGSLYLVSSEDVKSIEDLKDKKTGIIGRGQTPDIVFRNILSKNNIDPESLDLEYFASGTELANAIAAGKIKTAVLSEPAASMLLKKDSSVKRVLSINDEWKKLYSNENGFPQAALIIKEELLKKYPGIAEKLAAELGEQGKWLREGDNKEESLKKGELSVPAAVLPEIIKNSNINFLQIKGTEKDYIEYYKILSDFDAKAIGGKVPDSGIFYEK